MANGVVCYMVWLDSTLVVAGRGCSGKGSNAVLVLLFGALCLFFGKRLVFSIQVAQQL
jgi:hypothetical protein